MATSTVAPRRAAVGRDFLEAPGFEQALDVNVEFLRCVHARHALHLDVQMQSPRLTNDIRFRLNYARAN